MKILVLGASGMLGSTIFRYMSMRSDWNIFGSVRDEKIVLLFPSENSKNLITNCDVDNANSLSELLVHIKPNLVINCIGVIKQVSKSSDNVKMISINSLLPHRLCKLTADIGARLIHISTDCVFSGGKGNYTENDVADAQDIYGKSKYLGEVSASHSITLRTSIIGHELHSVHGLVEWFLSRKNSCKGYTKAIFSGLPTVVLAELIANIIIPRPDLSGVYHIAACPISKFDLLNLIAERYAKDINIIPDDKLIIDRSLCAKRFEQVAGYIAPNWPELIKIMYENQ